VSYPAFSRTALRIVATLAGIASLAACGYKGPLYLPTGPADSDRLPRVIAPLSFSAAPGVRITPAYPDYPPSASQQ
jgi:predicted small lipoprotein YifL